MTSKSSILAQEILEKESNNQNWIYTSLLSEKTCRLFSIWCYRNLSSPNPKFEYIVEIVEKYASGKATEEELEQSYIDVCKLYFFNEYIHRMVQKNKLAIVGTVIYYSYCVNRQRKELIRLIKEELGI